MHRIPSVMLPATLRLVSVTTPGDGDEYGPYQLHIVPAVQVACPSCGQQLKVRPGKPTTIYDLPLGDHPVLLKVGVGQAHCRACARTVDCALPAEQLLQGKRVTQDLARYLRRHMGKAPLRTLATRTGLTYHQVREIQRVQEAPAESSQRIRYLGLDEIFILKAKHLVAVDYSAARPRLIRLTRVSGSLEGRTSQALPAEFFSGLPEADIVTLDMNTEQMNGVKKRWPKATVVIDRRHLMEVINRDLMTLVQEVISARFENFSDDQLVKSAVRNFGAAAYPYLYLRALVLRRHANLTPADHASWMLFRAEGDQAQTLYKAYLWRESLHNLYDLLGPSSAVREGLEKWIDQLEYWASQLPDSDRLLSRTRWAVRRYRKEILNYAEYRLTNAQTELTNSMIRHYLRLGRRYNPQSLMALVNTVPPFTGQFSASNSAQPLRWYARAELPARHREQPLPPPGEWLPLPDQSRPSTFPEWPPRPEPWPLETELVTTMIPPEEPPAQSVTITPVKPKPRAAGPKRPRRIPKLLPEAGLPQQVWWWLHSKVDHRPLGERWYTQILQLAPASDLTAWSLLCAGQLGSALTLAVQERQLRHWRAAVLFTYIQQHPERLNAAERERQPRLHDLDLLTLLELSPMFSEAVISGWISLTETFASLSPREKAAMTLFERWHVLARDEKIQNRVRTFRSGQSGERTLWDAWRLNMLNDRVGVAHTVARVSRFLEAMEPHEMRHLMANRELRWATAAEWCLRDQLDVTPYLTERSLSEQRITWFMTLASSLEHVKKMSI